MWGVCVCCVITGMWGVCVLCDHRDVGSMCVLCDHRDVGSMCVLCDHRDVGKVEEGLGEKLGLLLQWMVTLIAGVVVSLYTEWRLTLVMALAGLLIAVSTAVLSVVSAHLFGCQCSRCLVPKQSASPDREV